jgi:hypothetical protein
MIGYFISPFCSSYQFSFIVTLNFLIFIFVIYDLYPQFSLRSRTPSISGSVCDPYTGRRVSYYFYFLIILHSFKYLVTHCVWEGQVNFIKIPQQFIFIVSSHNKSRSSVT